MQAPEKIQPPDEPRGKKVHAALKARLGDDIYTSWFKTLDFDGFDGKTVTASVPVKFLRNWIQSHYIDDLLACSRLEFKGAERVDVQLRQPGGQNLRVVAGLAEVQRNEAMQDARTPATPSDQGSRPMMPGRGTAQPLPSRIPAGGVDGSPLYPHHTFENFIVGAPNRLAHAAAVQAAETVLSGSPGINPLFLHSSVGLGKTHLLQAIAWDVRRRAPHANVLYLTAERFRYEFVEAVRSSDPLAFKERFRHVNMLLIDDLEFLQGEKTEQEFEHIINALLDGGRQVVVASSRPPGYIERLNERMRSRLQRGLVTEIGAFDEDLRMKVLERRVAEKKLTDPSFELSREILEMLAQRLTENGRELEGAVNRLHQTWQHVRGTLTPDIAETVIRDLVHSGGDQRRIKIEDILRVVSRHFGVSKGDLLSQRRHRSVVWPRQIGMYLAKQLTARSLPEIGRRFGNRDHTTVLHAIRKIEGELNGNQRLRDELEDLKKMLAH
ncbi:MAG: chromosomal replication initiator protein DnaA [Hyphomicrobium sp.]|nr:chromosomal replication initiator protein DnaA [Hyphomicrobium sp.]PPD09385.1 MAG: chromosomal replication initiator protein DnaA [Hyphomicrobium sp.]